MTNLLKFPGTSIPKHTGKVHKLLQRIPSQDLKIRIFEANWELLDLRNSLNPAEYVEFFYHPKYPQTYLANVSCPPTRTSGLFGVDADTYALVKLENEPLPIPDFS